MIVYKFGGASINNIERIQQVIEIVKKIPENEMAILVISAMGKTTNALEKVVASFYNKNTTEALALFNVIKNQHLNIAKYLLVQQYNTCYTKLSDIFTEVEWLLHDNPVKTFDYYYDQIVCSGELLSSTIIHFYCQENGVASKWIDIRDVLLTDNNFRDAGIEWNVTEHKAKQAFLKDEKQVYITQGFIGATSDNESTTLGREGSDFTAAILGNILQANSVTIWKDVEGVMSADPKYFPEAVYIPELSYHEVIEMAYYGAQVIHPKTIQPLQNKNIPLLVKCFLNPALPGTIIQRNNQVQLPPIQILKENQVLITLQSLDFSFVGGVTMNGIYAILQELKLIPNLIQFGAIAVQICMDDKPEKITQLALAAAANFNVQVEKNLQLFTVRHYNAAIVEKVNRENTVVLRQQTPVTIQILKQSEQH
ncbi:aspartate kinase [Hydrotalea sp.]|uniref:aspartate kinase n=1 Tax=Hydrotalea sp. TaxID=2881279 RepID=UPI00260CB536|nr:aspartate kinase [Hydrotalea sp.]